MKEIFSFENLEVWQKSLSLANLVYSVTINFPYHEKPGLVSQMRDAAISITSNIAESNARFSKNKEPKFMEAAYKSLMELISILSISEQLGFLSALDYVKLRMETDSVAWLLNRLCVPPIEEMPVTARR